MAWQAKSRRRAGLPRDWQKLRNAVFVRDGGRCRLCGIPLVRGQRGNPNNFECDHIGERWNHSQENLRALCQSCHKRRSSRQGGTAERKPRKQANPKLRANRVEPHPGIL
ncbi:HNH endonuclease [Mobiluncus mulieris]|uniref:HNH endonuclease n=1 Tax=Mobiluncus mulieris TaxID=2052 RepID=UPI00147050D4|nr:HNH endonuclease [Mobiluncus mulieris]NMW60183.1 HNH endonuclease [Mobiluncus mulieris]